MAELEQALWTNLLEQKGPFFRVLATTRRSQTGVMTVSPGHEAGPPEVHEDADQVIYVVEGEAQVRLWENGKHAEPREGRCTPGTLVVVPAGMKHWVKSVGSQPLFFLTVYGPPEY